MSEMSFEDMLNESFKTIRTGEVVTGKVIDVKPESILLNIGYKSDGIVNRADYSADSALDLTTVVKVGDELEAKVRKINDGEGLVVLSHRDILTEKNNQKVQEAFDSKEVLTGKVDKAVNGGLSVIFDGVRVFVPASLVSDTFERDLTKYVGQDIEFVITEFNPQKHRIIGDRKQLIVARKAAARKALLESIHEGDVIDGTVKNVTDFGAFVDLGGADGLLHISEMGWGRTESPKKAFHSGDEIRVMIKSISEEGKIALTRKFPDENPWVLALTKYAPGNVIEGKVARLADFGAFINLEQGIDALLHVSQISNERVEKPSDVLKVGDVIKAKVTDLDAEAKKISLSIKALLNEKARKEKEKEEDLEVADVYIDNVEEEAEEAPAPTEE
ncbi:MAG: 30S ribosomal protein S1 [Lachnospiraceae bacterium]|jgi:ribosomal protein S1|nr:30S ribosomal protein S1 [Lachnospiraceae bacterium]MBR2531282.1 30S ribosomal protein S1 [Lachnospiraceae bacterium]